MLGNEGWVDRWMMVMVCVVIPLWNNGKEKRHDPLVSSKYRASKDG